MKKYFFYSLSLFLAILIIGFISSECVKCQAGVVSWHCGCNPLFGILPWTILIPLALFFSLGWTLVSLKLLNKKDQNPKPHKSWGGLIIFLLLIIVFSILAIFISNKVKLNPPIFIRGSVVTEKGIVIENKVNSSAVQLSSLKIKKDGGILSGSEIKIVYWDDVGDFAYNVPCVNMTQGILSLKPGDNVEIHGVATADDTISVCGSKDYYLKKVSQDSVKDFILLKISDKNRNVFLEGTEDTKTVIFNGEDLKHIFNQDKSIEISGVGTILYKTNTIKINSESIEINGQILSGNSINFILKENGELQVGFIRTFK